MQYQCFLDACDHRYWTDYLDLAITDNVFRYNCFFFQDVWSVFIIFQGTIQYKNDKRPTSQPEALSDEGFHWTAVPVLEIVFGPLTVEIT